MAVWEYRFELVDMGRGGGPEAVEKSQEKLNALGAEGWEAVALVPDRGARRMWCFALLKREKGK